MTNTASLDLAIGGVAMPFVIAIINQSRWNAKVRGAIAFVACLLCALVLAWIHHTVTWHDWRDTAELVTGASLVMYHALWKPSGLAPAVESATSVSSSSDRTPAG